MKRILVIFVLVLALGTLVYADAQAQAPAVVTTTTTTTKAVTGCGGRLKFEGYAEYINFTGGDIGKSTWGGGILARYLFLDWLGAQTNVSFYSDCKTKELGGDLSFVNWRLSLLLHTYVPDICDKMYVYAGGGLGVQFNDDIGSVKIKDPLTGHVLAGLGYDINETLSAEVEVGYQFGKADTDNYTDSNIGVEALFVRAGLGIRF